MTTTKKPGHHDQAANGNNIPHAMTLQKAILGSRACPMITTDTKGIIQLFNAGAEDMLGYLASDVINRISPADLHDIQELKTRALALSIEMSTPVSPGFETLSIKASRGSEDHYELAYICKDGHRLPARISISALYNESYEIIGYLLLNVDNAASQQLQYELDNALAVIALGVFAKNGFINDTRYKSRTLLSSMLGFAQLLHTDSPQPTPTQQYNIEQILQSGWELLELINNMYDISGTTSGISPLPGDSSAVTTTGAERIIATPFPAMAMSIDTPLCTLLYIEDDPVNLMLIEDIMLRRPDIQLLSATEAGRGMEIARASRPDVILMDINLPGISGIEALIMLADDLSTAHIPVIALSANASAHDIKTGMEAGFFRYLTKPLILKEFMQTLDMTLEFTRKEKLLNNREN